MTIKLNNDADVCGTSLIGHVNTSYAKLVKAFGEPIESDGYKVSGEWVFEDDDGNVFTLYDWKSTNLYDPGYPSISEFRARPEARFHIGGNNKSAVLDFERWLFAQIS
jgi:hypothetical protein